MCLQIPYKINICYLREAEPVGPSNMAAALSQVSILELFELGLKHQKNTKRCPKHDA